MFYVIGSENSKSGSASYSSCQQNQGRGGAVRHFRCTDTVSDETDLWWNIGIQLYHHYTDTSLIRQVSESLSLYSEFQKAIFNGDRKRFLYWLGHLEAIYQRVLETSVYKGYKRDKIEMRVDRVEVSDFPLYLNTVAGGLDRRDQTIGSFSFVVKIYAVPVVEIIGQLLYLLGRYGFNTQFGDCL